MKRFGRGLVVGKFCPLHLGHERVIDAALATCDEVLVLAYTRPEFPYCEPEERRRWFGLRYPAARFPQLRVRVLGAGDVEAECERRGIAASPLTLPHNDDDGEDLHRRFCGWVCLHLFGCTVDAVFTSESYGDGFAASLSEQFGRAVEHVAVDPERRDVPISGTALRADPRSGRDRMAPEVLASFVPRIALLGGESSGKTTLAHALAQALGTGTVVEEFGRELWVHQGGVLSYEDHLRIAEVQVEREYWAALNAPDGILLCDTTPLTTLFYCLEDFGRVPSRLLELSRRRYALNVLCEPDFAFVQDGTRRDAAFRARQQDWYLEQLALRGATVSRVHGSVDERVGQVMEALAVNLHA